jgi:hypothetical protein
MHDNEFQHPPPGRFGYGYHPYAMPAPPFYYQGQVAPSSGYPFPQYPPTSGPIPTLAAPAPYDQARLSDLAPITYPEITDWFRFLDMHKERNKDGILFTPFGALMKGKGFLRITQLTLEYVKLKDLQDFLGIEVGTAILILQYAKEDVEAIKAGKWAFPKELSGVDLE